MGKRINTVSEKRPETSEDIVSRSRKVSAAQLRAIEALAERERAHAQRRSEQAVASTEKGATLAERSSGQRKQSGSRSGKQKGKRYSVDLASHMAVCDANYQRLSRLAPKAFEGTRPAGDTSRQEEELGRVRLLLGQSEAALKNSPVVEFVVLERSRFTTLLRLTLGRESDLGALPESAWLSRITSPHMTVRVYHDARSAEVVAYQSQNHFHGFYEYPNLRMRQRDEKAQLNRFLAELLDVCLEHGAVTEVVHPQ